MLVLPNDQRRSIPANTCWEYKGISLDVQWTWYDSLSAKILCHIDTKILQDNAKWQGFGHMGKWVKWPIRKESATQQIFQEHT